ncbi:MAG: DUF6481 family protein [Alphaproteobacteria bacterium]
MKNFEPDFADRQTTAAKAKQALIRKAKAKNPANDPEYAKKQAERRALNISRAAEQRNRDTERKARIAERNAAKLAEKTAKAEALAAEEAARVAALKAEQDAIEAEIAERERQEIELAAKQKAARDARYAARKSRQR